MLPRGALTELRYLNHANGYLLFSYINIILYLQKQSSSSWKHTRKFASLDSEYYEEKFGSPSRSQSNYERGNYAIPTSISRPVNNNNNNVVRTLIVGFIVYFGAILFVFKNNSNIIWYLSSRFNSITYSFTFIAFPDD